MKVLVLLLLSCLTAVGWSQPVCLCATDNRGSFKAVLTTPNDPFKYPPLVENLNASSFQDFHEVSATSSSGWTYLVATPPCVSTYIYTWDWPLGFSTDTITAHQFGECLVINPDGPYGVAMMHNYSLTMNGGRWQCDTDHRSSQISPDEIYLYACECSKGMLPAVSWNGARQCYRMNGTDQCGGDNCWTDTWHLKWNANHTPPCLGLCNGTDCNS